MKIVVLPGVGFHSKPEKYEGFLSKLQKRYECEGEIHYWEHDWPLPPIQLPYQDLRKWLYEVILDFQQVVKHAFDMDIPKADYYIGHSAGSILALAQKDTPCVIFGSPAVLVESLGDLDGDETAKAFCNMINGNSRPVFNIINRYDQLAYYLRKPSVENYIYRGAWMLPNTYNPVKAHEDYWSNSKVIKKIASTLHKWDSE
jgi:hypothetical protein